MTALNYAAASGSVNLLRNMLQLCDAELINKRNSVRATAVACEKLNCQLGCVQFGETLSQLAELRKDHKVSTLLDDWQSGNPMATAPQDSDDDDDDDEDADSNEDEDDGDQ